MRLATVVTADGRSAAAREDASGFLLLDAPDVGALLRRPDWREFAAEADGTPLAPAEVTLAPVVTEPRKILCAGLNYRDHILEMGRPLPDFPTLFTKFADTLTGAHDDIPLPAVSDRVDWEAELAVIVGSELVRADESEAADAVAGYTVANDVSMRDWQNRTSQWQQGKAFDRTTPLGPVMVTADAFDPADGARIRTRVNGRTMQDDTLADLVFTVPALLAYISTFTRLQPGDLVLTGTPGGVGAGRTPPVFLGPGDLLETEIDGIGTLRNRLVS
ncbi:fumarylacetoacetate hydrolase family protein [Herbiconiux sp. 11R-BC]|uniref:fumarylacetoacetate hydrolase family protein n=1 Tax=Herbiconiux sp. 11R-BC TaxID=3111637 RepID=UPI003BFD4E5A